MAILHHIKARHTTIGTTAIRRVLPHVSRKMVGPFIFMDHAGPLRLESSMAKGVPEHPHAGLSTFSYLMKGTVHHRDSAGHSALVRAGDIALMTAGSGITHEERPVTGPDPHYEMHLAQMWLALPEALETQPPSFELHPADTLPVVSIERSTVRIAMGHLYGYTAPTTCHSPGFFAELQLPRLSDTPLQANYDEQAIYMIDGDAQINGTKLQKNTLYILGDSIKTLFSVEGCHALYFGGEPLPGQRWIAGNFVASSKARLDGWLKASQSSQWPRIS